MRSALAIAALALAAGCDTVPRVGEGERGIIGGVEYSGDPAVVMTQLAGGSCTGTLIADRVVLTAAHCVEPAIEAGLDKSGTVNFGDGVGAWIGSASVRDMIAHRRYDNSAVTSSDIALVRLSEDAPEGVLPMPYNKKTLTEGDIGSPLRVVGFGVDDGEAQTGAGTKRRVELTIDALTVNHIAVGNATRNICQGDSGGPSILEIEGVDTVVAVSSYGSNFCMDQSFVTRTDVFADELVDEVVAAWSGPCQADGDCVSDGCGDFPDPDCDPCGLEGTCATGCPRVDLDCPLAGLAGDLCGGDDDCESRTCRAALDDPRIQYCSHECDPDAPEPCDPPLNLCQMDDDGAFRCYFAGTSPSAQGAPCTGPEDCRSGICDTDEGICAEPCGDGHPSCPDPYECVKVEGTKACSICPDGGCSQAPAGGTMPALFFLALLLLAHRRLAQYRRSSGPLRNTTGD